LKGLAGFVEPRKDSGLKLPFFQLALEDIGRFGISFQNDNSMHDRPMTLKTKCCDAKKLSISGTMQSSVWLRLVGLHHPFISFEKNTPYKLDRQ
jgi:hypothetical protein